MTTDQWLTGAATAIGAWTGLAVAHPIFLLIVAAGIYVAKTS